MSRSRVDAGMTDILIEVLSEGIKMNSMVNPFPKYSFGRGSLVNAMITVCFAESLLPRRTTLGRSIN